MHWRHILGFAWGVTMVSAMAQGSGRLYDPEPPADSAYLRTVVAAKGPAVDVVVDGKVRVRSLPGQEVSEYLVLAEGKHTLALHVQGKAQSVISKPLDIAKGKSSTLVFASLKADAQTAFFEDKGNSNKLKATLAAYHLGPQLGVLDITTADGANKVFGGLTPGGSAALQVNPIAVELAAKAGKGGAKVKLEMAQGGTYSIMVFDDGNGRPILKTFQSRVERYTGP